MVPGNGLMGILITGLMGINERTNDSGSKRVCDDYE